MNPLTKQHWVTLASWVLGGVFIYAGVIKVINPLAFADSVAGFRLLPLEWITPVALVLPMVEVLLGLAVVVGLRRRLCAMVILVLCGIFAVALIQALVRGIEVDCGCFGTGALSTFKAVWALTRDLGLGILAWWCCRQYQSRTGGED
jgi:putative oxidoreductase